MKGKACELCDQQACLYCPSDSAFLCSNCDAAVHAANFLVARHLRHLLCSKCHRFNGIHISGATSPSICTSTSESESCAEKSKARRRSCSSSVTDDARGLFGKWSREMGLGLGLGENGNRVVSRALSLCLGRWTLLPFRVAAATSFWLGLRFCGDRGLATCQNLTRLEAISGVPAKLILAAHARVFTHRRQLHLQEGRGESCP
ncbi:hypothetical protein VNO78_24534 [Psophocarpus tetragonolobus]|uniref:B box-type domain-containing protein n=1 Tax=Psophocarpus tetragonolobus TaxID=3891 RepID=A0AAN9S4I8_PSOTE